MHLLIQNKGEAHIESFTLLGASNSRGEGVIGQFGSGTKHAINVLLREGIEFFIYCGKTKLTFFTKEEDLGQPGRKKTHHKVFCKLSGTSNRTIDLGWVLDFGAMDWTEVSMALREFVSNAIDETIIADGSFIAAKEAGDLCVEPTNQVRAKSGYTRIYVDASHVDVQRFLFELPKRFLHFSKNPRDVYNTILPKADRNLTGETPMIYREGVLVREIRETKTPSLFDYNFSGKHFTIDEARNSSEYTIRAKCAEAIANGEVAVLNQFIRAFGEGREVFETGLDPYYLQPTWRTPTDEQKQNWGEAFEQTYTRAVCCVKDSNAAPYVQKKGYRIVTLPSNQMADVFRTFGLRTAADVLDENERNGREPVETTQAAVKALDEVWGWIEQLNLANGRERPELGVFRSHTDGECDVMGFYKDGKVWVRDDIASEVNQFLKKVMLEECVHYITGANDRTLDIQNFLISMIVEVCG